MNLDDNTLAAVVLIGLLIGLMAIRGILKSILSVKPPPTFRCARCRREFPHDRRTIGVWRAGKRKIFCLDCHQRWRETHPKVVETAQGGWLLPVAVVVVAIALVLWRCRWGW